MSSKTIKAGIIGAGYIADWHADALRATPGVELAAVCDLSEPAATALAARSGARVFTNVDDMLGAGLCDVVHILTPPQLHCALAVKTLQAGCHALVEKPVAVSAHEVAQMNAAAKAAGKQFIAGHNFMGIPGYQRLKAKVTSGALGVINSAEINWCFPLAPLRSGPFGLWMLRDTRNLLLELGPHLYAFAHDLFGPVEVQHLSLGKPVTLSGGGRRPQSWRIAARAGNVELTINLQLVETLDDRSLTLRGSAGMARLDYAADALTVSHENAADLVMNPLLRQMADGWQHLREGAVNATRQLTSLNRKNPYGLSFQGMFASVYHSVQTDQPIDARFSGDSAAAVMGAIDATLDLVPKDWIDPAPKAPRRKPKPTAMVIGGTGFIGRALTRALVASGRDVRVLSRGQNGPFADIAGHVETVGVSLRDITALRSAMDGIEVVYDLAKSTDSTWADALKNDVAVRETIAQAALDAGVKRLIYTGTIASYDMSDPGVVITEATGFGGDMTDRNIYARSKAECENRLEAMFRNQGLPLVIARPGIVVGKTGPLQHWGIGRWHGAGAVRIWGPGRNILPFVTIDDVTDALIRMIDADGITGNSYNLVGDRLLSARDYFDAIHQRLGARIKVKSGNLTVFWLSGGVKHVLKKYALRRTGLDRASLLDWKSRAHFSPFDNSRAKQDLGWQPIADKEAFLKAAVDEANLLGF